MTNRLTHTHHSTLYLFHSWFVKPQIKAIVSQTPNFLMVPIIANTQDGDPGSFDHLD